MPISLIYSIILFDSALGKKLIYSHFQSGSVPTESSSSYYLVIETSESKHLSLIRKTEKIKKL